MLELCLFRAGPSVSLKRVVNGDDCFLTKRDWSLKGCHCNGTIGVILFPVAKFEDNRLNEKKYSQRENVTLL